MAKAKLRFTSQPLNGWGYVAKKLIATGIDQKRIERTFNDPQMPPFSLVTFKLRPVESKDIYSKFRDVKKLAAGRSFIRKYRTLLSNMERRFHVSKEIVTAILLVETFFGENTGTELVLNRLARVSSVGESRTLQENWQLIKQEAPETSFEQVQARAAYLEETFLPELSALFKISEQQQIDIFSIKGSYAGAFGIPQFLPKSFLNFAVDGDNDGVISLFNISDAVFSTANFLKHYGWSNSLTDTKKKAVLWNYNRSQAYVDTLVWLAKGMADKK